MLSKRLQILITLMFVTMMFVQTPAMASNYVQLMNNGSNTNSITNQSNSKVLNEQSASFDKNLGNSNPNAVSQISSVNSNAVTFNNSGSTVEMNSSYYHPGDYLNLSINTTLINNFVYDNSFFYKVVSPTGQVPYPGTNAITLNNGSIANNSLTGFQTLWEGQTLNGKISYNSTSISQLYGVSIYNFANTSLNPTTEKITWQTIGNTSSIVYYSLSNSTPSTWTTAVSVSNFRNSHTINLAGLTPNTPYYYQIRGTDYFGRTISSPVLTFTTALPVANTPYISMKNTNTNNANNNFITSINPTNATITVQTQITANITLTYGNSKNNVNLPFLWTDNTTLHIIHFSPLNPGTEYYFKITAINGSSTSTDNNGGLYYYFITPQTSYTITNFVPKLSSNGQQAIVTFNTSSKLNASIIYSLDPNFGTYTNLKFDNASLSSSTGHNFTFSIVPAVNYYIKINITDGLNYYTVIQSITNNLYQTTFTLYSISTTLNTKTSSQDVSQSFFNFILQLPLYPAVLGVWQFELFVNGTNTIPGQTNGTNIPILTFDSYNGVSFIVNDSINFDYNATDVYIQRGSFTNGTGITYPVWMKNNQGIYSPTDNLIFIGKIAYSTSPTVYINNSVLKTTGSLNLFFNGQAIQTGVTKISDIVSAETSSTLGLYVNSSFFPSSNYDPNYIKVINVQVPAKDIYGNMTVQMAVNLPRNPSFASSIYVQTSNVTILNVKYLLALTNTTGQGTYSLTTTNFVGSATIFPYQYINVTKAYPTGNVSNFIQLPGSQINLTLQVLFGNINENIFYFARRNYTWYWSRPVLDSSLPKGNYSVNLLWTGPDGGQRGKIVTLATVYSSQQTLFSFSFSFTVSFTLKDLTANMSVVGASLITLRFKIIVPATGAAWDQNLGAIVDGNNATFDPVTAEYSINITSASQNGQQNVTVTFGKGQTGQISYLVNPNGVYLSSSGASLVNTVSIKNEHVSLTDLGILGVAIIATIVYAAFVFLSSKRR